MHPLFWVIGARLNFFFFFTLMVESENIVSVGFLVEINKLHSSIFDNWQINLKVQLKLNFLFSLLQNANVLCKSCVL